MKANIDEQENRDYLHGVQCHVDNCIYNKQGCFCTADRILIDPHHAITSQDTICATFQAQ